MTRILSFMVLFLTCSLLKPQNEPEFSAYVNATLARHGGSAVLVRNVQVDGLIQYPGQAASPFRVIVEKLAMRAEIQGPSPLILVQRGERLQVTDSEKRHYPQTTSLAQSPLNLVPALALLEFSRQESMTGSVVRSQSGASGIQFEKFAEGPAERSSVPFLNTVVVFWLDETGRIAEIVYFDPADDTRWLRYGFDYGAETFSPFLQPVAVTSSSNRGSQFEAALNRLTSNVSTTASDFEISR